MYFSNLEVKGLKQVANVFCKQLKVVEMTWQNLVGIHALFYWQTVTGHKYSQSCTKRTEIMLVTDD